MGRRAIPLLLFWLCAARLFPQDLDGLQIHGFATQGFLFSSRNNYLAMQSSKGSLQWTEGAVSLTDPVTENLRIGIQLHMEQLGQFGGSSVQVDWASGDYKFNEYLGFRAGKIKTPIGLFNDSQDVDSLFLWVLLPQSMYPDDNRGFNLAELGGELYGSVPMGKRFGTLQYSGQIGHAEIDSNGGYAELLEQIGMAFADPPGGVTYGGDLRWATPWDKLTVGVTIFSQSVDGISPGGSVHVPAQLDSAFYAQMKIRKLSLAGEYWRSPANATLTFAPGISADRPLNSRAWYAMASYQLAKKLQIGTYYSHFVNQGGDTSLPENYSKDWVISSRYDFNPYLYGKVEGHFLHGTGLGYYAFVNPNGLQTNSAMLAAKIGFSF